jgi:hypothetical protein
MIKGANLPIFVGQTRDCRWTEPIKTKFETQFNNWSVELEIPWIVLSKFYFVSHMLFLLNNWCGCNRTSFQLYSFVSSYVDPVTNTHRKFTQTNEIEILNLNLFFFVYKTSLIDLDHTYSILFLVCTFYRRGKKINANFYILSNYKQTKKE